MLSSLKKGQGLSINTIIIAAIALIVLVVLIAVFTGRIGIFGSELNIIQAGKGCVGQGYEAVSGTCPSNKDRVFQNFQQCTGEDSDVKGCLNPGEVCCF